MKLNNKRLLVTGATGGIGSALCGLLIIEGVELIISCSNSESLKELHTNLGSKHHRVNADISTASGREKIINTCVQAGEIDGLINVAGILDFDLFENQSEALIESTIQINMLSPMLLCRQLIPMLKPKTESVILNVGSIFGSIGHPGFTAYCASKAGLKCFSEALGRELDDTNIQVSYIAPRATKTDFNSSKVDELNQALGNKSDSPEYVASAVIQLLKSKQSLKYLGWPEKLFVRVNALFPGIVHKSLVKNLNTIKEFTR